MAIDDSNRLVKLFFDEEQKITLWYDKFERKLFVEDTNDLVKYLSDGSKYVPEKIPTGTEVLYAVAINGVLSIKFSQAVDRKTLTTLTVNDISRTGESSAKIIDFTENDTLVLMAFQNADTMIVEGTVVDKTKNPFEFSKLVAWPIIYLLFDSQEELSKYWQFNQKRLTSIGDNVDVTEKEFNYDGTEEEKSEFDWLTEEWKTFYYDPTTDKSYVDHLEVLDAKDIDAFGEDRNPSSHFSGKRDGDGKSLSTELLEKWALCYLREVPSGFKGEKEGPYWYATYFIKDKESDSVKMAGWIPDITSYSGLEELQDSYDAVGMIFSSYGDAVKYYKEHEKDFVGQIDSYIYRKGVNNETKRDNWYESTKGKLIQLGSVLVITKEKKVLVLNFKDGLESVINLSSESLLGVSYTFEKKDYGDEQDTISGDLILTRGNNGGLYNASKEVAWSGGVSPDGTEWNSNYTDILYGWNDLTNVTSRKYTTFNNALDGAIGDNILGTELVMRDKNTNRYWKFEFHSWTQGGVGGGFSYTRTLIRTTVLKQPGDKFESI